MKANSNGEMAETKSSARGLRCVETRDRADEWEQTPRVAFSRWTRTGQAGQVPSQQTAPTKFLRLLNCRTALALVACTMGLSLGGAGCAQVGTGTHAITANSAAGMASETPVINFTNLEDIPATTATVTCLIPCRNAAPYGYTRILDNLGLKVHFSNAGPDVLRITGSGNDVRCAAAAMMALDHAGDGDINSLEIFPLKYADADGVAAIVNGIFAAGRPVTIPSPQHPFGSRLPAKGFEMAESARVVARADSHSNSMVVSAPEDVIPIIRDLVVKLDQPIEEATEVRQFTLKNVDCAEVAKVLTDLFSISGNGQNENAKNQSTVAVVPDPRTESLLVTAPKDRMPQIVDMIKLLDVETVISHEPTAAGGPRGVQTDGGNRGATGF